MSEVNQFNPRQRVKVVAGEWLVGETGVIVTMDNNIYGIHVRLDRQPDGLKGYASFTGKELEVIETVTPEADPQAEMIASLQAEVDRLTALHTLARNALWAFAGMYARAEKSRKEDIFGGDTLDFVVNDSWSINEAEAAFIEAYATYEALQPLEGSQNVE